MQESYRANHTPEVILRDMTRIDDYPKVTETEGNYPWFRADLAGTYPRTFPRNSRPLRFKVRHAHKALTVESVGDFTNRLRRASRAI